MGYMESLQRKTKEELINDAYNARVAEWADYPAKDERGKDKGGKRIPYIGWYWRYTDFVNKSISIGDCDSLIGVMENNKWGYPDRLMTEQEATTFTDYLDRAFAELDKGGNVAELQANAENVFDELWNWFQTLEIGYR